MFGPLGAPEILFILLLALLIFGPRRLPEMGRTVGKALGEFRRATTDLKRSINTEIALEEADERPKVTRGPDRKPSETPAGGVDAEGLLAPAPVPAEGTEPRRAAGEGDEAEETAEAVTDGAGTEETAAAAGDGAETPAADGESTGAEAVAGEPDPPDAGDGADDGADDGEGEVAARG